MFLETTHTLLPDTFESSVTRTWECQIPGWTTCYYAYRKDIKFAWFILSFARLDGMYFQAVIEIFL